jgi:3-oxoacyl-[acyl-carrier protein] reductase
LPAAPRTDQTVDRAGRGAAARRPAYGRHRRQFWAAIAEGFAAAGAIVGIGYWRSHDAATTLAARLGPGNPPLRADLSTVRGCAEIVQAAFTELGQIDVWVNNAGADVLTGDAASWPDERKLEALLELDLKATIRC